MLEEEETYAVDDEVEDLSTAPAADTAVSDRATTGNSTPSSTDTGSSTPSSTDKGTPSESTASDSVHLPTPERTPPLNDPSAPLPATHSSSTRSAAAVPSPPISANFDTRNILPEGSTRTRKPRREAHAILLANTSQLTAFHSAFAAGITTAQTENRVGQHRDTLPTEPRSWKQMQRHLFSSEFQLAAEREINKLTKRETYK